MNKKAEALREKIIKIRPSPVHEHICIGGVATDYILALCAEVARDRIKAERGAMYSIHRDSISRYSTTKAIDKAFGVSD